MICRNVNDIEPIQEKEVEYEGKIYEIKNTWVRWLTHTNLGGDEYLHNHSLRHITLGPKGDIPMHSHKYTQIWYMLSGRVLSITCNKDGEREEREVGPGDFVYNYSFELHALKNLSDTEPAVFLCCIDCVDDKQNCIPPV
jgi:quercetin dioxygenase-like cupin family protein